MPDPSLSPKPTWRWASIAVLWTAVGIHAARQQMLVASVLTLIGITLLIKALLRDRRNAWTLAAVLSGAGCAVVLLVIRGLNITVP